MDMYYCEIVFCGFVSPWKLHAAAPGREHNATVSNFWLPLLVKVAEKAVDVPAERARRGRPAGCRPSSTSPS
jgi:hypothetical protein